jgi:NADH-quinone oxidoreductase subunit C
MDNATVIEQLRRAPPAAIIDTSEFRGMLNVAVRREEIVEMASFLRDDPALSYNFLENLCAVDYLGRDPRYEIVYHLLSFQNHHRICLKIGVPANAPAAPTLTTLWPTANWQEREIYDMFGITFSGHPGMYRILMPDDWEGYPLRKDVPLGYEEVAFTFNQAEIYARKPFAKE